MLWTIVLEIHGPIAPSVSVTCLKSQTSNFRLPLSHVWIRDWAALFTLCNAGSQEARYLGKGDRCIKTTQEAGCYPLVKFCLASRSVVYCIKKPDSGQSMLQRFLDPYLRKIVALHHLLTGIGRLLIKVDFIPPDCISEQRHLDVALREACKHMEIPYKSWFLIMVAK